MAGEVCGSRDLGGLRIEPDTHLSFGLAASRSGLGSQVRSKWGSGREDNWQNSRQGLWASACSVAAVVQDVGCMLRPIRA